MSIDITVAIQKREAEIAELKALREELLYLIADADLVARGKASPLTDSEFRRRLTAAENAAARLRVVLPYSPVDLWEVR